MSSKTKLLSLRNKMFASVTALVLGTVTMSTGAMAFAHGGGHVGGAGGHAMAMGHGIAIGHPAMGGGYYRGGNGGRFARGYGYGGAALGLGLGLGFLYAFGANPYGYCGEYPGYYYENGACYDYGW